MNTEIWERKPEEIEAVQLTYENFREVEAWCGGKCSFKHRPFSVWMTVPNVEGNQVARFEVKGEMDTALWNRLEKLGEYGNPQDFERIDLLKNSSGDYVIKINNRFSVLTETEMHKSFDLKANL